LDVTTMISPWSVVVDSLTNPRIASLEHGCNSI
jgi:hypothetical protein